MKRSKNGGRPAEGISRLTVAGYKSIVREQSIDIRPLTILAGANGSGKSSMMQPLLLLKQTLEAEWNPGPLRLDGPHVEFSSVAQFLPPRGGAGLEIGVGLSSGESVTNTLRRTSGGSLKIVRTRYSLGERQFSFWDGMSRQEIIQQVPEIKAPAGSRRLIAYARRGFLAVGTVHNGGASTEYLPGLLVKTRLLTASVEAVLHLRGIRGATRRQWPLAPVGVRPSGLFEEYVAGILAEWEANNQRAIRDLGEDLSLLGLASRIETRPVTESVVEIRVSRSTRSDNHGEMVNVADVGTGLQQVVPLLVALRFAQPGQLVYIEQPELHLHPLAQCRMADLLAAAAKRGVRVVAETLSGLLLRGIQTLAAQGRLPPALVALHWFERDRNGVTAVRPGHLGPRGAFGDWPVDFGDVELEAESAYLDAVGIRHGH